MFKSCFPNSNLDGNPTTSSAFCRSQFLLTLQRQAYIPRPVELLCHRQDKLFVVITAPPLAALIQMPIALQCARLQQLAGHELLAVTLITTLPSLTFTTFSLERWRLEYERSGVTCWKHHRYRNSSIEWINNQAIMSLPIRPPLATVILPAGNLKATASLCPS